MQYNTLAAGRGVGCGGRARPLAGGTLYRGERHPSWHRSEQGTDTSKQSVQAACTEVGEPFFQEEGRL